MMESFFAEPVVDIHTGRGGWYCCPALFDDMTCVMWSDGEVSCVPSGVLRFTHPATPA